jgi:hypothetical protein
MQVSAEVRLIPSPPARVLRMKTFMPLFKSLKSAICDRIPVPNILCEITTATNNYPMEKDKHVLKSYKGKKINTWPQATF